MVIFILRSFLSTWRPNILTAIYQSLSHVWLPPLGTGAEVFIKLFLGALFYCIGFFIPGPTLRSRLS